MRFLVLFVLGGFLLWKIIQLVLRNLSRQTHDRGVQGGPKSGDKPFAFKDVRDADFEEIKPEDADKGAKKPR